VAPILIKKYGNRRLYDTGDSKYVTLEELATKVRGGADLRVVDAQTGDDLTQSTLVQIVLEAGNAAKFLPVQLLTQMIRLSDDSLAEFFSRYVTGALDIYLQAKRGVQSIAAYNPLAQLPVAASDALARMWMGTPFAPTGYQQPYQYPSAPPFPEGGYPRPAPPPAPEGEEGNGERGSSPSLRRADSQPGVEAPDQERDKDREDVAAMRRELDELKQAIREGLGSSSKSSKSSRKKRKS
jgi:polyhydroxyalkanoate synthesis repressor PhaR